MKSLRFIVSLIVVALLGASYIPRGRTKFDPSVMYEAVPDKPDFKEQQLKLGGFYKAMKEANKDLGDVKLNSGNENKYGTYIADLQKLLLPVAVELSTTKKNVVYRSSSFTELLSIPAATPSGTIFSKNKNAIQGVFTLASESPDWTVKGIQDVSDYPIMDKDNGNAYLTAFESKQKAELKRLDKYDLDNKDQVRLLSKIPNQGSLWAILEVDKNTPIVAPAEGVIKSNIDTSGLKLYIPKVTKQEDGSGVAYEEPMVLDFTNTNGIQFLTKVSKGSQDFDTTVRIVGLSSYWFTSDVSQIDESVSTPLPRDSKIDSAGDSRVFRTGNKLGYAGGVDSSGARVKTKDSTGKRLVAISVDTSSGVVRKDNLLSYFISGLEKIDGSFISNKDGDLRLFVPNN